jgi:hypothetical protein
MVVDSSAARDRLGGGSPEAAVDSSDKNRQFVATATCKPVKLEK